MIYKIIKVLVVLLLFIGCNEYDPSEKWGKMISYEIPEYNTKNIVLKNCKYNNKYFKEPISTKYKNDKIKIVGLSTKSCNTNNPAIIILSYYYALIKKEKYYAPQFAPERIRIISPAFTSLDTGNYSYYSNFISGKKIDNIRFRKNSDGSINISSKYLTGK